MMCYSSIGFVCHATVPESAWFAAGPGSTRTR